MRSGWMLSFVIDLVSQKVVASRSFGELKDLSDAVLNLVLGMVNRLPGVIESGF